MPGYTIRPLTPNDWPGVFAAAMRAIPDSENDNRDWLRNRKKAANSGARHHHCVAVDAAGLVAGFGAVEEGPEPGIFRMYIVGAPEDTTGAMGKSLFDYLSVRSGTFAAKKLWVREEARDPVLRYFESAGFNENDRFELPNGREAVVMEKYL